MSEVLALRHKTFLSTNFAKERRNGTAFAGKSNFEEDKHGKKIVIGFSRCDDGADHGAEERPDVRSDQLPHTGCRFLPVGLHRAESSLENIGCQNGEGRAAPEWMQEGHEKSIDRYFMQPMRNDSESA